MLEAVSKHLRHQVGWLHGYNSLERGREMNMRNWRPEVQLATFVGLFWLVGASIFALRISETARAGQWGHFAVSLLCLVLITFAFALTLWYAAREHARSSRRRRQ
jgi:hypothetical protein